MDEWESVQVPWSAVSSILQDGPNFFSLQVRADPLRESPEQAAMANGTTQNFQPTPDAGMPCPEIIKAFRQGEAHIPRERGKCLAASYHHRGTEARKVEIKGSILSFQEICLNIIPPLPHSGHSHVMKVDDAFFCPPFPDPFEIGDELIVSMLAVDENEVIPIKTAGLREILGGKTNCQPHAWEQGIRDPPRKFGPKAILAALDLGVDGIDLAIRTKRRDQKCGKTEGISDDQSPAPGGHTRNPLEDQAIAQGYSKAGMDEVAVLM